MENYCMFEYKTESDFKTAKGLRTVEMSKLNDIIDVAVNKCKTGDVSGIKIYDKLGRLSAFILRSQSKVFVERVINNKDFTEDLRNICFDLIKQLRRIGYLYESGVVLLYDNNGKPSIASPTRDHILIMDALSKCNNSSMLIYNDVYRIIELVNKFHKSVDAVVFPTDLNSVDCVCWDYSQKRDNSIRILFQHV